MPLGHNHPLRNKKISFGTDERQASAVLDISRYADRCLTSKNKNISSQEFYLRSFSRWPHNSYFLYPSFGSDETQSFFTGKLTWLGQGFVLLQGIAFSEKFFYVYSGKMDMSIGDSYRDPH